MPLAHLRPPPARRPRGASAGTRRRRRTGAGRGGPAAPAAGMRPRRGRAGAAQVAAPVGARAPGLPRPERPRPGGPPAAPPDAGLVAHPVRPPLRRHPAVRGGDSCRAARDDRAGAGTRRDGPPRRTTAGSQPGRAAADRDRNGTGPAGARRGERATRLRCRPDRAEGRLGRLASRPASGATAGIAVTPGPLDAAGGPPGDPGGPAAVRDLLPPPPGSPRRSRCPARSRAGHAGASRPGRPGCRSARSRSPSSRRLGRPAAPEVQPPAQAARGWSRPPSLLAASAGADRLRDGLRRWYGTAQG